VRVLLTGHQGYLGTVMAPILAAGLDAARLAKEAGVDTGRGGDRQRPALVPRREHARVVSVV
jgi:hypothetical protein